MEGWFAGDLLVVAGCRKSQTIFESRLFGCKQSTGDGLYPAVK